MKNSLASLFIIVSLVIGLVAGYYGGVLSTPKAATTSTVQAPAYANVAMVVKDGWLNASADKLLHDAFAPTNITVYFGQTVNLTIVNFDQSPHSFTSKGYPNTLGVDVLISGASGIGWPTTTHVQFKPSAVGVYKWWCAIPCDDYAMAASMHPPGLPGYMGGYMIVIAT